MRRPIFPGQMHDENILVWLPSPMGDAVLCTPALRAIRQHFKSSRISFFSNTVVRQVLSPNNFNDIWLEQQGHNPFATAKMLKAYKFSHAILFKNSFASALACFLAGIPSRIGYAREARGIFLTDKLYPPKTHPAKFKPFSMIDYYLAIASWLGADTSDRKPQLLIDPQDKNALTGKLPQIANSKGPIVVLVPGGAFGPSKCWPGENFAKTADCLIKNYNATVVVSVASNPLEKQIGKEICDSTEHDLINLAENPLTLGQLKALFSIADLVISNDTGPRHITIALGRRLITLFGPNNPAWTDTTYENEIKIIGQAPCVPCDKPVCTKDQHLCMQSITPRMVCDAAKKLLEKNQMPQSSTTEQNFIELKKNFFIDVDYQPAFDQLGLTSIDSVFSFDDATNLTKDNLAKYRTRLQFEINSPPTTLFLKRYSSPPLFVQLKNWFNFRKRISCAYCDFQHTKTLATAGIKTPKTICYGQQRGLVFEKRSFCVTEKIPNAQSLERKLPDYFNAPDTVENLKLRRSFIAQLAEFTKKFHRTDYRHRDLYFSHIFYDSDGQFHLIDLARAFRPILLAERFRIKDIAQLYYSTPARYFSRTDHMRFYLAYTGHNKLTLQDKTFIRKVISKTSRMAQHDKKHGRPVPFKN